MEYRRDGLANSGPEDFGRLLEEHGRWLFGRLCTLVGSLQTAEDLLQDTLVAAYSCRARYRPGTSIRSWLYTIASNLAKNANRDGRRDVVVDRSDRLQDEATPERALLNLELRDRIDGALGRLLPERRAAITMRDIEGLGYAEIAEELGSTEGAARVRVHRAREQLQGLLSPYLNGRLEDDR